MNRKAIFLLAAVVFIAAPRAFGQAYSGSVLYPLMVPGGFSSASVSGVAPAQVVGTGDVSGTNDIHALLWTSAGAVDLNPSGMTESEGQGTDGARQVGYASGSATDNDEHAMLWTGTAGSAVDLNPLRISESVAYGVSGNQEVGSDFTAGGNDSNALLWTGTADSAIDLNPTNLTGITVSEALATNGSQQVGDGYGSGTGNNRHALLWTDTAASAVDLNPSGITESEADGTSGTQQVGWGLTAAIQYHAMLWTGTAISAVDLNPMGSTESFAYGTNGTYQVGDEYDSSNGPVHALLWAGTAESVVDLQPLLPSTGTWSDSQALSIDSSDNVYGTADGTFDGVTGTFAVEWSAVPEPATGSLLLLAGSGMLLRRRNRLI